MARLIEPVIARAVARRLAGDEGLKDSYLLERLERDLSITVPQSEALVAETSGIPAPPPVRWGLIDRSSWAEANIDGMTTLLAPLAERIGKRLDAAPVGVRLAQRGVISVEIGVLLGYVSRRVLGQYDLLVPEDETPGRDGGAPGRGPLYFVGPNIVETERRFSFVPREFALWVSLHEVTHRFQFAGVPWLRERFFTLVRSYMEGTDLDARKLAGRLRSAGARMISRRVPPEEKNPMYLLASPEQRGILDELQALMAVVEGHGNYVMDTAGAAVIPSFGRMRRVFQMRREHVGAVQRVVHHVIGLEMKLRQYEMGQRFCDAVAAAEGPAALRHLWSDPANMPSLAELREPRRWLARVA
jgi:coenzyme F420 biosynthesis associated uncharacterized protein